MAAFPHTDFVPREGCRRSMGQEGKGKLPHEWVMERLRDNFVVMSTGQCAHGCQLPQERGARVHIALNDDFVKLSKSKEKKTLSTMMRRRMFISPGTMTFYILLQRTMPAVQDCVTSAQPRHPCENLPLSIGKGPFTAREEAGINSEGNEIDTTVPRGNFEAGVKLKPSHIPLHSSNATIL